MGDFSCATFAASGRTLRRPEADRDPLRVAHRLHSAPRRSARRASFPWTAVGLSGNHHGAVRIVTTHLRARGVSEFLQNPDALRCWGALRRARSGQEARTIASAARTTVAKAQSALDCLASIGLAEPVGARGSARCSTRPSARTSTTRGTRCRVACRATRHAAGETFVSHPWFYRTRLAWGHAWVAQRGTAGQQQPACGA